MVAIRKARIAAGLVDSVDGGILPLRALRLEGFVVDALPFAQGFDNLERIDFLENCFDAGFALPESLREKVKVTKVKATGSREFSPEEVRQITEQVSELQVRTKSVPNLQKLAGLGMTRGQPIGLDKRPMLESRNSAAAVLKS